MISTDPKLDFLSSTDLNSLGSTEIDVVDGEKNANAIYFFGGPGVFYYDPTTIDRYGKKVHLHDWGTEGQIDTKYNNLQQVAKKIADSVVFLHKGRVHESGKPESIFESPKTQELKNFLGALHQAGRL